MNPLKEEIIKAAVIWERAKHEKVAPYENRDLKPEEDALAKAVQEYTHNLVAVDTAVNVPVQQ